MSSHTSHTSQTRKKKQAGGNAGQSDMLGGAKSSPYSKPPMKPSFRFHVLTVPHTVTRHDYSACAFTQKALKFCKMMHRRGHVVIHYGHKDSEVEVTEHVTITDNDLFEKAYGHYDWKKEHFQAQYFRLM